MASNLGTSLEVAKEEEPVEDPPEGESGTLEADSGGCHGRPMRAWWMNAVPGVRGIGVMRDLFSSQCACALDLSRWAQRGTEDGQMWTMYRNRL